MEKLTTNSAAIDLTNINSEANELSLIIKDIANKASRLIAEYRVKSDFSVVTKDSSYDFVTDADKASEDLIRSEIDSYGLDIYFAGEESTNSASELKENISKGWGLIVDPIDGTNNYSRGIPYYAVSIAFCYKGVVIGGVVQSPELNETFFAQKGKGAFLNNRRLPKLKKKTLEEYSKSLYITGFPYTYKKGEKKEVLNTTQYMLGQTCSFRRHGSASLDICYTANNRFSFFYEKELRVWDFAAAKVIVEEVGGKTGTIKQEKIENIGDITFEELVSEENQGLVDRVEYLDRIKYYNMFFWI